MLILSKHQLNKIKPHINKAIIKLPGKFHDKLVLNTPFEGKIEIEFAPEYNESWNAHTIGEVVKPPSKIHFDDCQINKTTSLDWDTEIEIEAGDKVACDYAAIVKGLGISEDDTGACFMCDGEIYVFVDYDLMWLRIRGEEEYPLNGYILCTEIDEEEIKTSLIVPDTAKKKSGTYLKVEKAGIPNKAYRLATDAAIDMHYSTMRDKVRVESDAVGFEEGDTILVFKSDFIWKVENDILRELSKEYVVVQRRYVFGMVENGNQGS